MALLGLPARADDFSAHHYALNFAALCVVLFVGTAASRAMKPENALRDPTRLFTLVGVFALLVFPMRSPGTPLWMLALIFSAMYVATLGALLAYKMLSR